MVDTLQQYYNYDKTSTMTSPCS